MLFVSSEPLSLARLESLVDGAKEGDLDLSGVLKELARDYDAEGKSFTLVKVANGYQLKTRDRYAPWVGKLFQSRRSLYMSRPALETLAVIAYRQPITRVEIEVIRGVNVEGILKSLLDRELIKIAGQKEVVGRPYLYRTSRRFLEYLGVNSLSELPPLEGGMSFPVLRKEDTVEPEPPAPPAPPADSSQGGES